MKLATSRHMFFSVIALSLAACGQESADESTQPLPEEIVGNECPLASSSNWQAWLNRMPGTDEPKLHITGDIEFAEPDLTASFNLGPLDRRMPPSQRILMTVQRSEGTKKVRQNVSADFPVLAADYRSIVIVCGSNEVATITEIEVAN